MFQISDKFSRRSMHDLRKKVAVSQRFQTLAALRAEFRAWNRNWKGAWRMRPVRLVGGGYAGVLRVKK